MTAFIPGNIWSTTAAARFTATRPRPVGPRLSETVALRCCTQYRKVFRCAAVSYPADVLRLEVPAEWIRRHGVAVDVADTAGLALALRAGVLPQRIIMRESAVSRAMAVGVGRFVVNARWQVDALAGMSSPPRRVLIDVTDQDADELIAVTNSSAGLNMIGVHRSLRRGEDGRAAIRDAIAVMRRVAGAYNIIPARLSLDDIAAPDWGSAPDDLTGIAASVDDAVENGCIASRFPSPAVNIALSHTELITAS
jgi:hypothetical protein